VTTKNKTRRYCGFCGLATLVNQDGTLRRHRNGGVKCDGSRRKPTYEVFMRGRTDTTVAFYGYCTICGLLDKNIPDSRKFLHEHDHRKFRIRKTAHHASNPWQVYGPANAQNGLPVWGHFKTFSEALGYLRGKMECDTTKEEEVPV
jgi:hypothetical protein